MAESSPELPSEQPVERASAPARGGGRSGGGGPGRAGVGLCASCAHRQLVPNTRGSVFWLCRRSRTDPRYPRYPRLPVLSCAGYERSRSGEHNGGADERDGGAEQRPRAVG